MTPLNNENTDNDRGRIGTLRKKKNNAYEIGTNGGNDFPAPPLREVTGIEQPSSNRGRAIKRARCDTHKSGCGSSTTMNVSSWPSLQTGFSDGSQRQGYVRDCNLNRCPTLGYVILGCICI